MARSVSRTSCLSELTSHHLPLLHQDHTASEAREELYADVLHQAMVVSRAVARVLHQPLKTDPPLPSRLTLLEPLESALWIRKLALSHRETSSTASLVKMENSK